MPFFSEGKYLFLHCSLTSQSSQLLATSHIFFLSHIHTALLTGLACTVAFSRYPIFRQVLDFFIAVSFPHFVPSPDLCFPSLCSLLLPTFALSRLCYPLFLPSALSPLAFILNYYILHFYCNSTRGHIFY